MQYLVHYGYDIDQSLTERNDNPPHNSDTFYILLPHFSMSHKKRVDYDFHHLVPKSKNGSMQSTNLVRMKRKEHEAYHTLFSNQWFIEALVQLFLMWEKCIKDWPVKRQLWDCLQNVQYKKECFLPINQL